MTRHVVRMFVGVAILALFAPEADAAPPSGPWPGRNFPSEKELSAFLEPQAPFTIPDPPPHEGALIDAPYVVEPPDLVIVEVLEALPGRPISGERLVRPDGTISLGFYGDVYVRGLTPEQIKVKIVLQLRNYLPDEVLGLYKVIEDAGVSGGPPAGMGEGGATCRPCRGGEPSTSTPSRPRTRPPRRRGRRPHGRRQPGG